MKVKDAFLDVVGKKILTDKNLTKDDCAERCLSDESCLSFEVTKKGECYLSKQTAASSKKIKTAKDRDYYQRVKCNYSLFL